MPQVSVKLETIITSWTKFLSTHRGLLIEFYYHNIVDFLDLKCYVAHKTETLFNNYSVAYRSEAPHSKKPNQS